LSPAISFGADYGAATCNWLSVGFERRLPNIFNLPKEIADVKSFAGYRICNTKPFNIWEFLSKFM
jgi:hypothetical protein